MINTDTNVSNRIRKEELDLEKWLAKRERSRLFFRSPQDNDLEQEDTLHVAIQNIRKHFRFDRAFNYKKLTANEEFFNQIAPQLQDKVLFFSKRFLI